MTEQSSHLISGDRPVAHQLTLTSRCKAGLGAPAVAERILSTLFLKTCENCCAVKYSVVDAVGFSAPKQYTLAGVNDYSLFLLT